MKGLHRLLRGMEELRKYDPDMPSQMVLCFLIAATKPSVSMREVVDLTGLSQASVSRNFAALSKVHRLGTPGLDWVDSREDPAERRRKLVTLTAKGRKVAEDLNTLLEK